MKRMLLAALLIGGMVQIGSAFSFTVDQVDSGSIAISTSAATPTQILTNNPAAMRTYIVNSSTNNVFLVGPSSTSASGIGPAAFSTSLTTGSFYLQGNTAPNAVGTFTPDGPDNPYRGPLWAVAGGQGGTVIQRIRIK